MGSCPAERPDSIVFMGIGEPFHNYEALLKAIRILSDERGYGMSPSRMTVSTAGVVPMIKCFGAERLRTHLAISLNATENELRRELMPGADQWTIAEIVEATDEYVRRSGRRATYAYVLLDGINDTPADAARLRGLLAGRLCHVNLIPYNPTASDEFQPPPGSRVREFAGRLEKAGIDTTVRFTKGRGVDAACGQLRLRRAAADAPQ
jgi:23S rRNA (adenine2503-C2)-methyltransferase